MGSMRAAPKKLRTKAEVRVRTVPEVEGWESLSHKRWLAQGGLREEEEVEEVGEIDDYFGVEASEFRDTWNQRYSSYCGSFEDTSKLFFRSSKSMEPLFNFQLEPLFNLQLVPRSYCFWPAGSLFLS